MNIFQFWAAMACPLTGWQSPLRTWLLPGFSNSAMCGTDPPYFTVRGTYFLCQVVNVGNLCHGVLNTNGTLAKRVTEKNRGVQRRWYIMIGSISLMLELGSPILHSVRIHYTTVPQFLFVHLATPWYLDVLFRQRRHSSGIFHIAQRRAYLGLFSRWWMCRCDTLFWVSGIPSAA